MNALQQQQHRRHLFSTMSVFRVKNRRQFLRSKTGADFRLRKSESKIGAGFRPRVSSALLSQSCIAEYALH